MTRYNNAFSTIYLLYLTATSALLVMMITIAPSRRAGSSDSVGVGVGGGGSSAGDEEDSSSGALYWPFVAEMIFVFFVAATSMMTSILWGVRCNELLRVIESIVTRRTVAKSSSSWSTRREEREQEEEASGAYVELAEQVAADLRLHHERHAVEFLYQSATPQLFKVVYGFISFLFGSILSAMVAKGIIRVF